MILVCRFAVAIAFAAASLPTRADDWTREDTYRQTVATALFLVDWGQTRYIIKHPEKFHEVSPALGAHPSMGRVNIYMGAHVIGHAAISYLLPPPWRKGWQYVWIGLEANQVRRNASVGIKIYL